MKLILIVIFFCIFFIALIFSVMNFHSVEINLGITSLTLPLTIALTIELFAGIAIGYLAAIIQILKLKSDYAQLNKQFKKANK